MKKMFKRSILVIAAVMFIVSMMSLSGCSNLPFIKAKYTATTDFFYSSDKGHSYGNGTKEYAVGETVYMKVLMEVTSNKKKTSQVVAVLTIPNSDAVDAKYMDGQIITPNSDPVNNVTTYEFTVNASNEPQQVECVIQYKPNAVGTVPMTFVYDDNLDSTYDKQNTLEFVEPELESALEPEPEPNSTSESEN